MKALLPALLAVSLSVSCISLTRNAVWEPAQDDEAMVVLFVGMEGGLQNAYDMTFQSVSLAQVVPELIGPLPFDPYYVEINGTRGIIFAASSLPAPATYKLAQLYYGQQVNQQLYVTTNVVFPSAGNTGPMVNAARPGVHFMGSYFFVKDREKLLAPFPAITEAMVLENLKTILSESKPTWAAKIGERLAEVAR